MMMIIAIWNPSELIIPSGMKKNKNLKYTFCEQRLKTQPILNVFLMAGNQCIPSGRYCV